MIKLPDNLRDHLTKQTLALAAAYTLLGVPILGIFGLITFVLPEEMAPQHKDTLPNLFTFFENMMVVFGVGFASLLFGWIILIGLLILRLPLSRLRVDGMLPLTLTAAALGAALYALAAQAGATTLFSDVADHSLRVPVIAWCTVYGLAYGLILHWLLHRAAKGQLHQLG